VSVTVAVTNPVITEEFRGSRRMFTAAVTAPAYGHRQPPAITYMQNLYSWRATKVVLRLSEKPDVPEIPPPDNPADGERRRRGRPRMYADDAAKSRAYRARKAAARAAGNEPASRLERVTTELVLARTEAGTLRERVAELEQLVAERDDELRRYRQGDGRGVGR
jgi:hypothetical protein